MWRASRSTTRYVGTRSRRGISLLEAVAALAIVGATSAGILASTGAGVRAAERARRAHEAAALAEETIAQLSLLDASALRALPDSLASGTFAPPFDEYAWEARVLADPSLRGLHAVDVTVRWEGGAQSVSTALYRRDGTSADGLEELR